MTELGDKNKLAQLNGEIRPQRAKREPSDTGGVTKGNQQNKTKVQDGTTKRTKEQIIKPLSEDYENRHKSLQTKITPQLTKSSKP